MKKDLTGQKFGRLIVLECSGTKRKPCGDPYRVWKCECTCGNEIITSTSNLTSGDTKSCGCLKRDTARYHYEGKRFGNLTVVKEAGIDPKSGGVIWLCKCDCGNECKTLSVYLRRGFATSCGCMTSKKMSESSKTHGMSNTRLYNVWSGMKERCTNPNNPRYKNYGERGIKVCDEWLNNFETFYKWAMESGYNPNAKYGECTIDRIDINGNYEPNNCRWISNKRQQLNRSDNRHIIYNGEDKTLTEWSECLGINQSTLKYRLNTAHWSVEKAFETPVKKMNTKRMGVSA